MQFRSALLLSGTFLLVSILFFFEFKHHRKIEGLSDLDFTSITSQVLQGVHDEGFAPVDIDYKDPLFLQRKIFITGDIDSRAAEIIMKKLLYLDETAPGTAIDLYIDSNGGTGGYTLSNFLLLLKSPVNTYALDWCCSSAAEVLAAGTGTRAAFPASRIVVHIVPSENEDRDDEKFDRQTMEIEAAKIFWSRHSRLPKNIMESDEEKFFNFTAAQALEFGLIDEILPGKEKNGASPKTP